MSAILLCLKLHYIPNFDMVFLVMGFISLSDEINLRFYLTLSGFILLYLDFEVSSGFGQVTVMP